MTLTSSVNYKDSYFEHPVLTAIRGEPTYETINHLKKWSQIKREFSPNHLCRRQSWLPRHDPHTRRVSPHHAYWSIHSATKFGRPHPKPVRHGRPNLKRRRHTLFNKIYIFRNPAALTNLHPTNHRCRRHQISRLPSQPYHQTNYATRQVVVGWCVHSCCAGTHGWSGRVAEFVWWWGCEGRRDIWCRRHRWFVGWRFVLEVGFLNRVFPFYRSLFSALAIWAAVPDKFGTKTPGLGGRVNG